MPTNHYGHLLVVNAFSFTTCAEIQLLTNGTDVKLINPIRTETYDGQLLYDLLDLAMRKLAILPRIKHFRIYQVTGTPTSHAYRTRDDFMRALTLNRDDLLALMTAVYLVDSVDQIESLLHCRLDRLHQAGAAAEAFAASIGPIQQAIAALRQGHYDHHLEQLAAHLANRW